MSSNLLFQQKAYSEELMRVLQSSFQSSQMSSLATIIFVACVTIGLFQCFRDPSSGAISKALPRFGIRLWLAFALVYGGKYVAQSPALSSIVDNSKQPLALSAYYQIDKLANKYADKLTDEGADSTALQYKTEQLMSLQDNILLAVTICEDANRECLSSYLLTGNAPVNVETNTPVNEEKSFIEKWIDSVDIVVSFLNEMSILWTRFISNPGILLFPILVWLLHLISSALTIALSIMWGLIIGVSMVLIPIVTPFMIIKGFENNIKSMYKTFFATALYGFSVKLIVMVSTLMMTALEDASKKFLIPTILQMAENSAGNAEVISDIKSFLLTNFILSFAIISIQLVGLTKVPSISRSLMFTSIDSLVNLGEVLFNAGLGFAKMVGKFTAVLAATVATAGVAAAGAAAGTAVAAGATVAAKAGATVAAKAGAAGASKIAGKVGANMLSKGGSMLSKGVSNIGAKAKNISSKSSLTKKMGNSIFKKSKDLSDKISDSAKDLSYKSQKMGNNAQKFFEQKSIFKKDLNIKDKKEDQKNDKDSNQTNNKEKEPETFASNLVNKAKNNVVGRFAQRVGSKIDPKAIANNLYDASFDLTKMGAESSVKDISGDPLDLFKKTINATADIDFTGVRTKQPKTQTKTQNKDKQSDTPKKTYDQYGDIDNLKNVEKNELNDQEKNEYDELYEKMLSGTADDEEIKKYKNFSENYNLDSKDFEQYNELKSMTPELNKNNETKDLEAYVKENGLTDETYKEMQEKYANNEISKNDLNNKGLQEKIKDFENKKRAKIETNIDDYHNKVVKDNESLNKDEKEKIISFYHDEKLKNDLQKEQLEKLIAIINDLKKE